jgi:DNA-binding beta-propeller fold protein YncE
MKKMFKMIGVSVLAASLAGGAGASAAGLSQEAFLTDGGRWMTELTTYAGTGGLGDKNSSLLQSVFRMPESIAVTSTGDIMVSDSRNQVIRKLSGGQSGAYAGVSIRKDNKGFPVGGLMDGKSDESFFNLPAGVAVDAEGNVFVADAGNHAIRKISAGGQVTTLAGDGVMGAADGKGKTARFYNPRDVAVAKDGTVYVADTLNHLIRKIGPDGTVTTLNAASSRVVEVFPGQAVQAGDYTDGDLKAAKFNEPSGLALDAKGNLYVSDAGNQRIRYIDLTAGKVTTAAGGGVAEEGKTYAAAELYADGDFADGAAADARFNYPAGIAVTEEGGLLIADAMNHSVRYLKDGKVLTLAGQLEQFVGESDGIEGYGELHAPTDVALLPDGRILVADSFNNKLRAITLSKLPESIKADGAIHVVMNGMQMSFDAAPEYSPEGRTMIPVRAIAEAAGYEVKWTDAGQLVGLTNGKNTVEMAIGQRTVIRTAAGKEPVQIQVDAAPYIKNDRTYVPVRFFAENLGIDVQWDSGTSTAILRTKAVLAE